tara:strand:+ start:3239 stop:4129 length:891 start_codon:yes stop_codon:yes gene_type:complete
MLRSFLIGCVQSSQVALDTLIALPEVDLVGVYTAKKQGVNSDFLDVATHPRLGETPIYYAEDIDHVGLCKILQIHEVDILWVIGWSKLIPEKVLSVPRIAALGYHPAALPKNRGRHPIIWALALGLEKTASTLFILEPGADSGPIVDQRGCEIGVDDYAQDVYAKLVSMLPLQITDVVQNICSGKFAPRKQNENEATYWRKREPRDGVIDWRMSAASIQNLVRALAHPYVGAEFLVGSVPIKVWRSDIVTDVIAEDIEPGKVLSVSQSGVLVKAGDGAIMLREFHGDHDFVAGEYL